VTVGQRLYAFTRDGAIAWQRDPAVAAFDSFGMPVVGDDGTVYVEGDELLAFSSAGDMKWNATEPSGVPGAFRGGRASPALGPGGAIYAPGNVQGTGAAGDEGAFSLASFSAAGAKRWQVPAGPQDFTDVAPVVAADGSVLYGTQVAVRVTEGGAVQATGVTRFGLAGAAVGADGTLYVRASGSQLAALGAE
jgi:hypothetical protein